MSNQYMPLTQSQLMLWAGQKLNPESPLHNTTHAFDISGTINVAVFQKAFKVLVDRVDALRFVFLEKDGTPYQTITLNTNVELELIHFDNDANESDIKNWLKHRSELPLDLTKQVFDAALLSIDNQRYIWFLNMHHLVTDAVSATLVYKYLTQLYKHVENDALNEMIEIPSFKDYIIFENNKQKQDNAQNYEYWTRKIKGFNKTSNFYGKQSKENSTASKRVSIKLGLERYQKIKDLAKKPEIRSWSSNLTHFNILATAFFVYIHRISGDKKIVFGAPAHNRINTTYQNTVGLFIEIFPVVMELTDNDTFYTILQRLNIEANNYLRHVKPGMVVPEVSRSFNTIFNFITASFSDFNGMPMQSEWMHTNHIDMTHQLRCHIYDFDATGNMEVHFDLNNAVFNNEVAQQVPLHFLKIVDAIIEDINQPINKQALVTTKEITGFLTPQLGLSNPYVSILYAFENHVKTNPNAVALQYKNETLTYKGLNKKTNQLAHYLSKQGVVSGTKIAIYNYRNSDYIISVLATKKLGTAFVPIASSQPSERVGFIISDSNCSHVLTNNDLKNNLVSIEIPIIDTSSIKDDLANQSSDNLDIKQDKSALAYVLYTSGSTGNPKGVQISNKALSNYIFWAKDYYDFNSTLAFALCTSIGFDLTITSTFLPLASVGRIIIYKENTSGPDTAVLNVVEDNLANAIKLTPSHLMLFKDKDLTDSAIEKIIVGGENFKVSLGKSIKKAFGNRVQIYNEYGPTEATVGCIVSEFNPEKHNGSSVPIGKPILNMHAYILDGYKNLVPKGVIGTLHLSGDSLANGYLDLNELTTEKFVDNPFVKGQKMYNTGDLARINENGEYEYLGRVASRLSCAVIASS